MPKRARVTLVHYTAPPIVGGVENVIAEHARLLCDNGYDVEIVAGRSEGETDSETERIILRELDARSPENRRIDRALQESIVVPEFADVERAIAEALGPILGRADVVIAHNVFNFHFNLPLTAALHRLLDTGSISHFVAWCHDISRHVNPASGAPQYAGFPWDLLRTYCPEVKYVAVSPQRQITLAHVLGCSLDEIRVIPNGVSPEEVLGLSKMGMEIVREKHLLEADLVLLMPVRVTRAKNIEYALRVAAALKDKETRVKLVITGPPDPHVPETADYFQELVMLRHDLGLQDEVVFLYEGTTRLAEPLFLPSAVVNELYRVCDVVLMPSHREGFALPVFEAGMVGKPIFCTDLPVLDMIPREDVHVIGREETPVRVAARILDWAEHTAEQRLRQRVRQEFNWTAVFQRAFKPLLDSCLEKAKSTP